MTEKCERCGKQRKLSEWRPGGAHVLQLCQRCIDIERANRKAAAADNGGAQPGAGRPASEDPRSEKVMLAFTVGEMASVNEAAKVSGEKPSTFARSAAVERAHAVMRDHKSR